MPYNLYNVNQKEKEKEVFLLDQWFYLKIRHKYQEK